MDQRTMSIRLDRRDVNRLFSGNIDKLTHSSIYETWTRQADQGAFAAVTIFPITNETTQDVGPALDALLSKFETGLVGQSVVDVISRENQPTMIAETENQQSDSYSAQRGADFGKQIAARYFITGKFYGVDERDQGAERVQYFVNFQVIDSHTGTTVFQNTSSAEPSKLNQ